MKAIKMIGLAALAALMAMAFVGASSAMAEEAQLCGHDGSPCEAVHHIHETSVGKAKLLTSIGTTECDLLFLGDVLSYGTPTIISGKFTYSNCELGGSSCTATEENGPSKLEVTKEGHEAGSVIGEGLVHLTCGSLINCAYNGKGLKGSIKGPLLSTETNGEVTISEQETTKEAGSGFICPKTGKLDLKTTPLSKVYLTTGLLGYCVETEHTNGIYTDSTCKTLGSPEGHSYKYSLVFGAAGSSAGEVLCYGTLLPFGLWEEKVSGVCQKDNSGNTSLYEKGTIKTVE